MNTVKKSQKWGLSLIMTAPAIIILIVFLMISDVSVKEIPWWALIGVPVVILSSPFTFFLTQRSAQRKKHNTSLQEKRKRILIVLGILIAFFFIVSIITHIQNISIWKSLFSNIGNLCLLLLMIATSLYSFFYKDKEQKTTDNVEYVPLLKKRKWLTVLSWFFIISLSIIATIYLTQEMPFVLRILSFITIIGTLWYIYILFFPKKKEFTEDNHQNNSGI